MGKTLNEAVEVIRMDQYVGRLWPKIEPLISAALVHSSNEVTSAQLREAVIFRRAQLWLVISKDPVRIIAASVTEVIEYPNVKTLRIITLAGEHFKSWHRTLDETLQRFAREQGATSLEAVGRKGLGRLLEDLCFKPIYTHYRKEVEDVEDGRNYEDSRADGCSILSETVC